MKYQLTFLKSAIFISLLLLNSCATKKMNADIVNLKFTVEEAPEWTALFNRSSGWFGGDGVYAIPLNGKNNETAKATTETLLVFGDTMIGEISDGTLQPGSVMVHQSVVSILGNEPKKDKVSFLWKKNELNEPESMFIPTTPTAKKIDYYWLGDGFVNTELNNTTYIFAYRMRNLDKNDDWSFTKMGTNLIALPSGSRPPFKEQRQIETPLRFDKGEFGAGIFVNTKKSGAPNPDGYVYIYGVKKDLMVARVMPKDFENFSAWRFWDGKEWNKQIEKIAFVTQSVSNVMSVSALPDGRYALVFTLGGLSPTIGLRLGITPYGPFGPVIKVWEAKEMQHKNYITYNARAYPNLSAPGELLISYNVNAFDFKKELKANPNLYRPRFIKLKLCSALQYFLIVLKYILQIYNPNYLNSKWLAVHTNPLFETLLK